MFIRKPKYPVEVQLPEITNHQKLPVGANELARINDKLNYGKDFIFVFNNQGLSILKVKTRILTGGAERYSCHQTDFPMGFLSWFPAALRDFRQPPSQGGLHEGAMTSSDEDIEGEMLCIQRLMDAGNQQQGYCAMNRSRCRRGVDQEGHFLPQEINFAENFLYEGGLLKLIEDLGERYEKGLL